MFGEQALSHQNGKSATVGIREWLLLDCLSLLNIIPIVGSIAYIVIILVIGFGSSSAVSMKNRIIASLIWIAIWVILVVVIVLLFGSLIAATLLAYFNY